MPEKHSKLKLFVENILVYGFGGIIRKIIPFVMVPIITRMMPNTTYFGISDMSNTIVSFASALAIMGMYDAMYRMFFEKDEEIYKKTVCSTALSFTLGTSFLLFAVMILMRKQLAVWFLKDVNLSNVIYLSAMATLVGATNSIISAPTRMQNHRKIFLIANTVGPLLSYCIAFLLLLKGYYLIALPLAAVISGITMETSFYRLNRSWFSLRLFDKSVLRQLLIIAIPLVPNFLIYWVFNSSDKLMITHLMDIGAEGIYSVGAKLGHASQLIYTAFGGGWQFFAFSTMKEPDQVKNNSLVFEYLGVISFMAAACVCTICYSFYKVIFPERYWSGYIVAPYLFLAPLLQMLFQVASNQFLVIKKTWPNLFILFGGAILNIFLNLLLIPVIGIEGASIATLVGYVVSDIVVVIVLCKMKLMVISGRFLAISGGIAVFFLLWRLLGPTNILLGFVLTVLFITACALLYREELTKIVSLIKKRA